MIRNPATGETLTFVVTSADSGGKLLQVDVTAQPHKQGPPLQDETVAMPPGRAARPEDCVLSRARISFDTNAPCVRPSERPSHPGDGHRSAKPSYTLTPYASVNAFSAYDSDA